MKNLFITLLIMASIFSINCQLTATWSYDWQNSYNVSGGIANLPCLPDSFVIAGDNSSTPANVTYTYGPLTAALACRNRTNYTFSELTGNTSTNVWTDSFGQQIIYNSTYNYVQFTSPNVTGPSLFSVGGEFLSSQYVTGSLAGTWNDPQQVNGSSTCCVPNELFISQNINDMQGNIFANLTYNTTCSANKLQSFSAYDLEVTTVNYNASNPTINLAITPYVSTTQIEVNLTNGCVYTYSKVPTTVLLNDTWILDWQSSSSYPANYTILTVNDTYMMSSTGTSNTGFVAQNPQGQYYDPALSAAFTFDNNTDTLLGVDTRLLYSKNGSYLSPNAFINFWGVPETTNNSTDCCLPSYINISSSSSSQSNLYATYIFSEDHWSNSACADLDISDDSQFTSEMWIQAPSTVQLTWVDNYSNISFANASDSSTIAVRFDGQCNFTMVVTSPPPPKPLYGGWVSIDVLALVMGIFIVLASL